MNSIFFLVFEIPAFDKREEIHLFNMQITSRLLIAIIHMQFFIRHLYMFLVLSYYCH